MHNLISEFINGDGYYYFYSAVLQSFAALMGLLIVGTIFIFEVLERSAVSFLDRIRDYTTRMSDKFDEDFRKLVSPISNDTILGVAKQILEKFSEIGNKEIGFFTETNRTELARDLVVLMAIKDLREKHKKIISLIIFMTTIIVFIAILMLIYKEHLEVTFILFCTTAEIILIFFCLWRYYILVISVIQIPDFTILGRLRGVFNSDFEDIILKSLNLKTKDS